MGYAPMPPSPPYSPLDSPTPMSHKVPSDTEADDTPDLGGVGGVVGGVGGVVGGGGQGTRRSSPGADELRRRFDQLEPPTTPASLPGSATPEATVAAQPGAGAVAGAVAGQETETGSRANSAASTRSAAGGDSYASARGSNFLTAEMEGFEVVGGENGGLLSGRRISVANPELDGDGSFGLLNPSDPLPMPLVPGQLTPPNETAPIAPQQNLWSSFAPEQACISALLLCWLLQKDPPQLLTPPLPSNPALPSPPTLTVTLTSTLDAGGGRTLGQAG